MIETAIKRGISLLSPSMQIMLKEAQCRVQMAMGSFRSEEQEYDLLPDLVRSGDVVLDLGANVGHYTARLSELVGPAGRVYAFEPFPQTFAVLKRNAVRFKYKNVMLINMAASDHNGFDSMKVGRFDNGLPNRYMASIAKDGDVQISCTTIDRLNIPNVSFIKIDIERHEMAALRGMEGLLARSRPTILIEDSSEEVRQFFAKNNYSAVKMHEKSPNMIYHP